MVNTSATVPAAVRIGGGLAVHFSTPRPNGAWLIELPQRRGRATVPYRGGMPGQVLDLPGGAALTLEDRVTGRLWRARLSTAVLPYLFRHGAPIRYSYVEHDWPLESYQTVFGTRPGSAEMPSASRPFTPDLVTRLVARGIMIAPLTLHTGVSSLEGGEDPYPEPYDVARHRPAGEPDQVERRPGDRGGHYRSTRPGDRRGAGRCGHRVGRLDLARGDAGNPGRAWWTRCSPGCTSRAPRTC